MIVQFMGKRPVDFTNTTGETITGTTLYVAYSDPRVTGLATDRLFVKSEIAVPNVKVGDQLIIDFDLKGKVLSLTLAKN